MGLAPDNLYDHLHDAGPIGAMRTADSRMAPGEDPDVTTEDEARACFAAGFEQ